MVDGPTVAMVRCWTPRIVPSEIGDQVGHRLERAGREQGEVCAMILNNL